MLFTLAGKILIDDKSAQKSLTDMDRKAKSTGESMSQAFASITKAAAVTVAAIAAVGAASFKMVNKYADHADKIHKESMKLGVSMEAYQELAFAMGQVGVDISTVQRSLARFNTQIGEAAQGNEEFQESLFKMGFSYEQVMSGTIDADTALMALLTTVQDMSSAQEQAAFASKVLGVRMYADMMPAFNALEGEIQAGRKELHDLNGVMSDEAVLAAVKYRDRMNAVKESLRATWRMVGESLLPAFQEFADYMYEAGPEIRKNMEGAIDGLNRAFKGLFRVIERYPEQSLYALMTLIGVVAAAIVIKLAMVTGAWIWSGAVAMKTMVVMSAKAMIWAVKMAAAILIAMGPIGWIVAAIGVLGVLLYVYWDEIVAFTIKAWEKIKAFFVNLWDGIKTIAVSVWGGIRDFFVNLWDKILEGVEAFRDFFGKIFATLVDYAKKPINVIIGIFNGFLSTIEKIINKVSGVINSIPSIDIPDWVPVIGGGTFSIPEIPTVSIPSIPALAKGGTITSPGWTMVGEKGPELLSLNKGATVSPLDRSNRSINVFVELDGRTIARVIGQPLVEQIRIKSGVRS